MWLNFSFNLPANPLVLTTHLYSLQAVDTVNIEFLQSCSISLDRNFERRNQGYGLLSRMAQPWISSSHGQKVTDFLILWPNTPSPRHKFPHPMHYSLQNHKALQNSCCEHKIEQLVHKARYVAKAYRIMSGTCYTSITNITPEQITARIV